MTSDVETAAAADVVLAMTLHNNAPHLPAAIESLLSQTYGRFILVLLDDGSRDATEDIARRYAAGDSRLRFHRHAARQGMIAAWRRSAELAFQSAPSAKYFAWVSDHDRWHPEWLAMLKAQLEAAPGAVLAYPQTRRTTPEGEEIVKPARTFDTAGLHDVRARWRRFCRGGAGAGDMVYGLMRVEALRDAGVFRPVLRPDRLLIAELVLRGEILQVPQVLWFRRNAVTASVARQRHTLMLRGAEPGWFWWPPWMQHARMLRREYDAATLARLGLTPGEWGRMRAWYQATYGWRHARKSETSYVIGRGLDGVVRAWKLLKHYYRHAVYRVLVTLHGLLARRRQPAARPDDIPGKSEPM